MLAKELKIANLMAQRNYILNVIEDRIKKPFKNGDPLIKYRGEMFTENIRYFTDEGFKIDQIMVGDMPVNLFRISSTAVLSREEREMAGDFESVIPEKELNVPVIRRNSLEGTFK